MRIPKFANAQPTSAERVLASALTGYQPSLNVAPNRALLTRDGWRTVGTIATDSRRGRLSWRREGVVFAADAHSNKPTTDRAKRTWHSAVELLGELGEAGHHLHELAEVPLIGNFAAVASWGAF